VSESFSVTLTDDDLIRANRLNWRSAWLGRAGMRYWLIMTIIMTIVILVTASEGRPWSQLLPIALILGSAAGILTALICATIGYFSISTQARRMLQQNQMLRHRYDYYLSEDVLRYEYEAGSGEIRLDDCYKWAENDDLFMLYLSAGQFYALPKRALTTGQCDRIRGTLQNSRCPVSSFANS